MKQERHIQFWETAQFAPSREDALRTLALALDLLYSALPLALKTVGGLSEIDCAALREKLSDWAAVARERIGTPRGEI